MPIVTFAQLICLMYADPSAWEWEDLREEVGWLYEEAIEAAWYSIFERLARMTRSDVLPEFGIFVTSPRSATVEVFVTARVRAARQHVLDLSIEEFWAFAFEPAPEFVQDNQAFIASLPNLPQPPIPAIWLEPPGPTCDMCGSRGARAHHTGMEVCETCCETQFNGCWF